MAQKSDTTPLMHPRASDHDLQHSISVLQQRIVQLESQVARRRDAADVSSSTAFPDTIPISTSSEHDEIAQSLEAINLGVSVGDDDLNWISAGPDWPNDLVDKLSLLPSSSSVSWQIIEHSLTMTGWLHCAINVGTLRQQHDDFWQRVANRDLSVLGDSRWMALYLAILAVNAQFQNYPLPPLTRGSGRCPF